MITKIMPMVTTAYGPLNPSRMPNYPPEISILANGTSPGGTSGNCHPEAKIREQKSDRVIDMPTIIKLGNTGDYMRRLQRVFARMTVLGLLVIGAMPAAAAEWVPDHVVIVIEENLSVRHLTRELGYLTSLLREGANFTDAHGIDHPSQPNYLALFSGDTQGTGSEKNRNPDGSHPIVDGRTQVGSNDLVPNTPLTTPNLGAALIAAGRSFVGYSEDLPSVGFTGASHTGPEGSGVDYQRKHNPWVNWQAANDKEIGRNQLPSTTNLPFTSFPRDDAGFIKLPTVAIVVPNQINDGHGSPAAAKGSNFRLMMNDWLRRNIEPYRRWAMTHNSLLIITWDEDEDDSMPVTDANGVRIAKRYINLIPTVMLGQGVVPGTYDQHIDLYSLLRTIEDFYGLKPLAASDAKALPIRNAFRKP